MKNTLITGGKLAIICGIAAIVLGFVNAVTEPVIIENQKEELRGAIEAVAGATPVEEKTNVSGKAGIEYYYQMGGPEGGSIVKLVGTGYGGDMHILAGYYPNGEIFSVVLMENQETPGLGKKAESPEYMKKFIGTGGEEPVPVLKGQLSQAEADAITGATITFVGIAQALQKGAEFVQDMGEDK